MDRLRTIPKGLMAPDRVRKFVLIADDQREFVEIFALLLGYVEAVEVTTAVARNGLEAVELSAEHHPDVAVLDIDMPVMNGFDAALAIRRGVGTGPRPLLIAMTGRRKDSFVNE